MESTDAAAEAAAGALQRCAALAGPSGEVVPCAIEWVDPADWGDPSESAAEARARGERRDRVGERADGKGQRGGNDKHRAAAAAMCASGGDGGDEDSGSDGGGSSGGCASHGRAEKATLSQRRVRKGARRKKRTEEGNKMDEVMKTEDGSGEDGNDDEGDEEDDAWRRWAQREPAALASHGGAPVVAADGQDIEAVLAAACDQVCMHTNKCVCVCVRAMSAYLRV